MDVKLALLVALFGCSGKTTAPKTVAEDARGSGSAQPVADAGSPPVSGGKGDVQIRVEWKNVPADARATPGRTACGTPRPPAVAPTTTWGIPEVFVAIDAPATTTRAPRRVVLDACALSPRAVITSGSLALASATDSPVKLAVVRAGQLPLGTPIKEDNRRDVYLPIAGHEVSVALEPGTITHVIAGSEDAWVIASDSPFVAVTEGGGTAVLRGVPAGTHDVVAWLPPRSGQSARVARAKVTVTAGALAEATVDLTTQ